MKPEIEALTLQRYCPKCRALPGQPCVKTKLGEEGEVMTMMHAYRYAHVQEWIRTGRNTL